MAATVTCYGTEIRKLADPASSAWGSLGVGPVLGIYGRLDAAPSPAEATAFEAALLKREVVHNITIYDGVGHAFINPEAYSKKDAPTHDQAVRGWTEITDFLQFVIRQHKFKEEQRRLDLMTMDDRQPVDIHHQSTEASNAPPTPGDHDSLSSRIRCALKCALDVLLGSGHFNHAPYPTFGLEKLLEIL